MRGSSKAGWAVALISSWVLSAEPAAAINISTCGQYISDGDIAVLTTDLVCDAGTTAVTLGIGSTLILDGHSIVAPDGWGVWCQPAARCTILGGGTFGAIGHISGAEAGVYLQRRARLTMSGVAIQDCDTGVLAEDWNARGGAKASLTNVEVTGSNAAALRVATLKLENVTLNGNPGDGIAGLSLTRVKADGLTVTGNAFSDGCEVYGCGGIDVGTLSGRGLVVTDNNGIGIHAISVRLANSTVINNVRAGSTKDLVTGELPHVHKVACNVSLGWGSQSLTHWGVCSRDD